MEKAFIEDYINKIKLFNRDEREQYDGEYTFTVRLGVFENTVEIKDTHTMYHCCK